MGVTSENEAARARLSTACATVAEEVQMFSLDRPIRLRQCLTDEVVMELTIGNELIIAIRFSYYTFAVNEMDN